MHMWLLQSAFKLSVAPKLRSRGRHVAGVPNGVARRQGTAGGEHCGHSSKKMRVGFTPRFSEPNLFGSICDTIRMQLQHHARQRATPANICDMADWKHKSTPGAALKSWRDFKTRELVVEHAIIVPSLVDTIQGTRGLPTPWMCNSSF